MKRKSNAVTVLLLFCMLMVPELFAQLSFKTYRNFASRGDGATCVATGDFNNDGIADLAITNGFTNTLSVMLGDGRGGFLAPTLLPSGNGAFFVTTADVDGDNNLDLVVANFGENTVSVLLGDGTGRFGPRKDFIVANNATGVVVADFNGDGIMDLAVADFGLLPEEGPPDCSGATDVDRKISILLGLPAPAGERLRFDRPIDIETGCAPEGIYSADFNGDGYPDLVVTNFFGHTIAVLLGDGDGGFTDPPTIYTPGTMGPAYGVIADFNEDGKPDFAATNWNTHTVSVLLGNGQGEFPTIRNFATQPVSAPAQGKMPRAIVAGDFNGDGHLDLATSNHDSNDVSVLFGNGQGNFSAPKIISIEGRDTWFMTMGDFNMDGILDFAVVREDGINTNNISILTGDGLGNFGNFSRVANTPVSVAAADFDGDGKLDLAIANRVSNDVWVRLGDGSGGFGYNGTLAVGNRPAAVAIGDFNNDNFPDLATANAGSNNVTVWFGDGQGGFSGRRDLAVNGVGPNYVLAVDLNGDRRADIVTADVDSNTVSVLIADDQGGFLPVRTFPVGGRNPTSVAVADLNGDRHLDLVTTNSGTNDISVLFGDGTGRFSMPSRFTVGQSPRSLVIGDYDGDSKLDVAVLNTASANITVLYGDGRGGFPNRLNVNLGQGRGGVYLSQADLDGDQILDLAVADFDHNQVHLLKGTRQGSFLPPLSLFAGVGPVSLAIGDFRGAGKKDIAVVDQTAHTLDVLINTSRP